MNTVHECVTNDGGYSVNVRPHIRKSHTTVWKSVRFLYFQVWMRLYEFDSKGASLSCEFPARLRLLVVMADIIVTTLAGRRYCVPRSFSGSVEDLKCLLETAWSIPTREQRLFHDFEELTPCSAIQLGVCMCIMMVRRNPEQAYWLDRAQRGYFWDDRRTMPHWIFNDWDVMLAAVSTTPRTLSLCDLTLQNDPKFVMKAIEGNGMVLTYTKAEFRSQRRFVTAAIHSLPFEGLHSAPVHFRRDVRIVMQAVRRDIMAFGISDRCIRKRCRAQLKLERKMHTNTDVDWMLWPGSLRTRRRNGRRRV